MSWESAGIFLVLFLALGGLNLAAVSVLFRQRESDECARFEALRREGSDFSHAVEHRLAALEAELADYVRREDWIRFGAVIDARLETLRREAESVREKLYGHS